MASDLLTIARSGTKVSRIALDVTAQNIANASTDGYVRRSVQLQELASTGGIGRVGDISLSGVRLDSVIRNSDLFRQSEVRRTSSDAARANAEVAGLTDTESAVETAGVYPAMVDFEASLQRLSGDPTNASLRAAVIEDARTMASTFNIASNSLNAVGEGLRFEAGDGVTQVNTLAGELARVNLRLARAADGSSDQSTLLDRRDLLLQQLSTNADVTTTIKPDQTVEVRLGGSGGELLVQGGTTAPLAMAAAADGTISFTLNGNPIALSGGALTGKAQALSKLAAIRTGLDGIANSLAATANTAQANGAALDGSAGQPLFSGTGAAGLTLALNDGSGLATAPSGAAAGSRDPGNLDALRSALTNNGPTSRMDVLLFDISSTVAGRTVTRDTLQTIAATAKANLDAQSGVDLDQEAVNLVRYQQAFQASGRAMQVASDIFDTLLGIG